MQTTWKLIAKQSSVNHEFFTTRPCFGINYIWPFSSCTFGWVAGKIWRDGTKRMLSTLHATTVEQWQFDQAFAMLPWIRWIFGSNSWQTGHPKQPRQLYLGFSCIPMQSNGPNNCNTIPQLKKPRTESRSPGSIPCFSSMGRCRCWFYASFMHEVYLGNSCIVSECCESELIIAHPPIPFSGELLELKMESKASNLISVHLGNEIYTTNDLYHIYIYIYFIYI